MKGFQFTLAVFGIFVSSAFAAPWVVLDSRNDMLAMSSEVSDSVMTYALPPATLNIPEPEPRADETAVQITSTTPAPENIAALNDDIPVTTGGPLNDDLEPAATTELNQEELKMLDEVAQEIAQSTTQKSDNEEEEVQHDLPEVTTEATLSSSSSVDSLFQQDNIPSEGMMDMDMEIKFSDMADMTRKNPNSIEEDEPLMSVVVVSKKKHEIFSKKSKYHM